MKYEVTTEFGKVKVDGGRILVDEGNRLIIDGTREGLADTTPIAIFASGIWQYFLMVTE